MPIAMCTGDCLAKCFVLWVSNQWGLALADKRGNVRRACWINAASNELDPVSALRQQPEG
jgi:hypothetical protein